MMDYVINKLWVIQGSGAVLVTRNPDDDLPRWEEETDQSVIYWLTSPEARLAAERNTYELFGGRLFGLESFDLD